MPLPGMVYQLNSGLHSQLRPRVQAAVIALAVTIGVPTLTAVISSGHEIYPGPSIVRSGREMPGKISYQPPAKPAHEPPVANLRPPLSVIPSPATSQPTRPVGGFGGGPSGNLETAGLQPAADQFTALGLGADLSQWLTNQPAGPILRPQPSRQLISY